MQCSYNYKPIAFLNPTLKLKAAITSYSSKMDYNFKRISKTRTSSKSINYNTSHTENQFKILVSPLF